MEYAGEIPVEDRTVNVSSLRFYLKNLVPKFKEDHGVVPASAFIGYLFRSNSGFFESRKEFLEARRWIEKNKYRFRMDGSELIKNWSMGKEK